MLQRLVPFILLRRALAASARPLPALSASALKRSVCGLGNEVPCILDPEILFGRGQQLPATLHPMTSRKSPSEEPQTASIFLSFFTYFFVVLSVFRYCCLAWLVSVVFCFLPSRVSFVVPFFLPSSVFLSSFLPFFVSRVFLSFFLPSGLLSFLPFFRPSFLSFFPSLFLVSFFLPFFLLLHPLLLSFFLSVFVSLEENQKKCTRKNQKNRQNKYGTLSRVGLGMGDFISFISRQKSIMIRSYAQLKGASLKSLPFLRKSYGSMGLSETI